MAYEKIREILSEHKILTGALEKMYLLPSKDKVIQEIEDISNRESEGLFLLTFYYLLNKQELHASIEKLIELFIEAGKDLSFMVKPEFSLRFNVNKLYLEAGPLTEEERKNKNMVDKYVPLYTSRYKDTYRVNLPLDLKKHIQGFVTGYNPKVTREKRRDFLIDQIRNRGINADLYSLTLSQLENIYKQNVEESKS